MAFQMTAFEIAEHLNLLVTISGKGVKVQDYIQAVPDERKRTRISAVLQAAVDCHKRGVDPLKLTKIVCWRDEAGKPSQMQLEMRA